MTVIRILHRDPNGLVSDGGITYGTEQFAGQVPMIGDTILDPGAPSGKDRNDPRNRTIWTVVARVFNHRDNENTVSIIVESRKGTLEDEAFA